MTVGELKQLLLQYPDDLQIYTNECEATSAHEETVPLTTVGTTEAELFHVNFVTNKFHTEKAPFHLFIGTGEVR